MSLCKANFDNKYKSENLKVWEYGLNILWNLDFVFRLVDKSPVEFLLMA